MSKPVSVLCPFFLAAFLLQHSVFAEKPALPSLTVPDGLGYNIHFTDARPGELEQLAASGATIIRMDFFWGGTEREKGKYDFSAFERLTDSLEKHKIRPLYILDYSNGHYDNGLSPCSDEGRKAFAKWAAAAAVHFKDRGIIWEMYNEPNIGFWKPKPNAEDYIKLALETGKALREAAPNEIYIGPATSEIDIPFLEQCFKAGLLEYWDAVSVHPYRQSDPETVITEYAKLRYLIDKYAPKGKKIPILSAEWGYSSAWSNYNDERQGKYLPRQWMVNLAADVPVSIWYDWHDDGKDPKEAEHHFGTTNHDYKKDQTPVYDPKPSYIAAKTFNETFKGFKYNKRLWTGDDEVFVFLFNSLSPGTNGAGNNVKLAAWTTAKEPKNIEIPCSPGEFGVVSYLGEKLPELTTDTKGLTLTVSDGPVYLMPLEKNEALVAVAYWACYPLAFYYDEKAPSSLLPIKGQPIEYWHWKQFAPSRFAKSTDFVQQTNVLGKTFLQNISVYSTTPTSLSLPILEKNQLVIKVENPSGEKLAGEKILIKQTEGIDLAETVQTLELKQGETGKTLVFPLKSMPKGEYKFSVSTASSPDIFPVRTMKLIEDFSSLNEETLNKNWGIHSDGDAKVGSEQKAEAVDGLVKITYKFDAGWKFVLLVPKGETAKIEGKPKALGLHIDGDGSGNSVNIRFADSKGQTFQIHGGRLTEKKPYYFEFAMDGTNASHWGGPNDGNITYPIRFDAIIVDGTRQACGPYSVTVASPVLIY